MTASVANRTLFTRHAQLRMQQRGVPRRVLQLLLVHGETTVHAGEGCESITLSHDVARCLVEEGFNPDEVARAAGLAAILGESGIAAGCPRALLSTTDANAKPQEPESLTMGDVISFPTSSRLHQHGAASMSGSTGPSVPKTDERPSDARRNAELR